MLFISNDNFIQRILSYAGNGNFNISEFKRHLDELREPDAGSPILLRQEIIVFQAGMITVELFYIAVSVPVAIKRAKKIMYLLQTLKV
jgi:hypothetical protein